MNLTELNFALEIKTSKYSYKFMNERIRYSRILEPVCLFKKTSILTMPNGYRWELVIHVRMYTWTHTHINVYNFCSLQKHIKKKLFESLI